MTRQEFFLHASTNLWYGLTMNSTTRKALRRAIAIKGTQLRLALALDVSQSAISVWLQEGQCPADQAIPISKATKGLVTRSALRPDIYPPEHEKETIDG